MRLCFFPNLKYWYLRYFGQVSFFKCCRYLYKWIFYYGIITMKHCHNFSRFRQSWENSKLSKKLIMATGSCSEYDPMNSEIITFITIITIRLRRHCSPLPVFITSLINQILFASKGLVQDCIDSEKERREFLVWRFCEIVVVS